MFKQPNNQNIVSWLHLRQRGYSTHFFSSGFIEKKLEEYQYLQPLLDALRRGQSYAALSLGEYYLSQQIEPDDDHSIAAIEFLIRGVRLRNLMCLNALIAMCEESDSTLAYLKKKLTSLPPKMVIEIHNFVSTASIKTVDQIVLRLIELAENSTNLVAPEILDAINEKMQYLLTSNHLPKETIERINVFVEKGINSRLNQLTIKSSLS